MFYHREVLRVGNLLSEQISRCKNSGTSDYVHGADNANLGGPKLARAFQPGVTLVVQ